MGKTEGESRRIRERVSAVKCIVWKLQKSNKHEKNFGKLKCR